MSEPSTISESDLKNVVSFNTESVWFRVITFILAGAGAAIFIANTIYWDRFRKRATTGSEPTKQEADGLYYTNLVLSIIFVALAIWAILRLVYYEEERKKRVEAIKSSLKSSGATIVSQARTSGAALATRARSALSSTQFGIGSGSASTASAASTTSAAAAN